jgi:hypothetical protein
MDTPGHARHHFCVGRAWRLVQRRYLRYFTELDTVHGPFIFPTTTPIQFDPPALAESIERLMARRPENMYLTHFGRVRDLRRLADDMLASIEQFARWGESFAGDERRRERIEGAMMQWLIGRARAHGVSGPDALLVGIFQGDVTLNTQGIEFWLDHGGG